MRIDDIKSYVDRFIKTVKANDEDDLQASELLALAKHAEDGNTFNAVGITFSYGYIKGYRAAMAELKKGGAV